MKGYTIQHSIELLEEEVKNGGGGGASTADNVSYDNTTSHLTADNVQEAIDELETQIGNIPTPSGEVYSTTETQVGTWIDNRPVYRKVVSLGTLPDSASTAEVDHNISDLDFLVDLSVIAYDPTTHLSISIPFPADTTNDWQYVISANVTETKVRVIVKKDRSALTAHAILTYVKTVPVTSTRKKKN